MYIWILAAVALIAGGVPLVKRLLHGVSARGGAQGGDAAQLTGQAIAQVEAFRANRSSKNVPWDGKERAQGLQGNETM